MASRTSEVRRQWKAQLVFHGYLLCGICKLAITSVDDLSVDHIIPKSKGGSNRVDNLQPSHWACNQRKDNDPDYLWEPPVK